ncbi:alpha/beta hydrolase [Actinoplanes flavus]|uniref:Alpha/beta fold hydrolase n=1 Tax=Actinoplanes flavus TaxID=2820290 RepID=A0ABS3URF3_9ACTN|nr:alpha/beta fold hydrolase [Actinoplanes flavus]MBO3741352.1 alpha/beta fold hydrolase [Actinoplanes flavus]
MTATTLVATATAAPAAPSTAAETRPTCVAHTLPVRLADPGPATQTLWGELCYPRNARPTTVQFLVHGGYSNHAYWDFPVGNGYYSYVRAATAAGYATFNVDLIGAGHSSHPLSSQVTSDAGAVALHDAITALRQGTLDGHSFGKVIWVGHGTGSYYARTEIPRYGDVDALIQTSALHGFNAEHVVSGQANVYPAVNDPKFANSGYDAGYITTKPGTRASMFLYPATTVPAVAAADEALKDVQPTAAITPPAVPHQIRVPVLVVGGAEDWLGCQGVTVYDCHDPASVLAYESNFYLPEAQLEVALIPQTGHLVALATTAPLTNSIMLNWAAGVAAPQ